MADGAQLAPKNCGDRKPAFDRVPARCPVCTDIPAGALQANRGVSLEQQALAAQGRLIEAIEALSEGLAVYDADERLIFCNETYRQTLPRLAALGILRPGVTFTEILRAGVAQGFVPPAYRDAEDYFTKRLNRFRHPDGPKEYVSTNGRWYRYEETKTSNGGTVAIRADITDRKGVEISLQESEEIFRNLAEGSLQGICILSPDRKPIYVNQAYADIFGYGSTEDVLALESTAPLAAPHDRDRLAKYRQERLSGEFAPAQYEYDGVRKDGAIVHLQAISRRINWKGQDAVQVTLLNVTERKRAEQALLESEERLRAIVDNTPWFISLKDTDKKFLVINEAYAQSRNVSVEKAVGKSAWDLEDAEYAAAVDAYDDKVLKSRQVVTYERDQLRANGIHEVISVNKYPALDAAGNLLGVATIAIDVRRRKEAEARQQELENSLHQAQKMEVVGQLTGGVAHDFNNLLGIIIGNLDFLEESLQDHPELLALTAPALKAALSGAALNRQLLSFSRRQSLSPRVMNLNDHVSATLDMLGRTLGETIVIKAIQTDALWLVKVDSHYLESALLNLAVNARDAMPGGGTLTIMTSNAQLGDDYVSAWEEMEAGDYVVMTITDTGTGIAPDILEHVFEPFFTTKEVGQGSGLGLSMVFGFAKQSGGHVTISSEVDRGTTVKLYLPRATGTAETAPEDTDDTPPPPGKTILVVEDDPDLRAMIVTMLNDLGHEAIDACDGTSALEIMRQTSKIDILLTDIVLPGGMSGPEIAAEAGRSLPDVKVLFMSGYPRDAITEKNRLNDNVLLLEKPFRKAELISKLHATLTTLDPVAAGKNAAVSASQR